MLTSMSADRTAQLHQPGRYGQPQNGHLRWRDPRPVSSQAWKHAMRQAFAEESLLDEEDVGKRTKKGDRAGGKGDRRPCPGKRCCQAGKGSSKNAGLKDDEKKDEKKLKTLIFLSKRKASALAELGIEGCTEAKSSIKMLWVQLPSVDMVLFGRMVAEAASLNYDAAAQVAHSISTHAVQNEYDYFTAVDDCPDSDNAGASHLGTKEYNLSDSIPLCNRQCDGA